MHFLRVLYRFLLKPALGGTLSLCLVMESFGSANVVSPSSQALPQAITVFPYHRFAATDTNNEFGYDKVGNRIQIREAAFMRPISWGAPSSAAPDVILVSNHTQIQEELAKRSEEGRAPPKFAVATPPFLSLLESLLFDIKYNHASLVEGTTALGKSFAVETLASLLGIKLRAINVHPGISDEDLLRSLQPDPNRTSSSDKILVFKDGHLVQAMEQGEWLSLEELNMGSTSALETLNLYLSHGEIYVRRNGHLEKVKIDPRFRLFASMNPTHYTARQLLSRPFLSRWVRWILGDKDHPDFKRQEQAHLVPALRVLNNQSNSVALQLVQIHQSIAGAAGSWTQGQARSDPYQFDQRHLLRMAKRLPEFLDKAGQPKKFKDLTNDEKKSIALAFWGVYASGLREQDHKDRFFGLMENPLGLKAIGIENAQALDDLLLDQIRQGAPDTEGGLKTFGQKLPHTPLESLIKQQGLNEKEAVYLRSTVEAAMRTKKDWFEAVKSQRKVLWQMLDALVKDEHILLTGSHGAGKTSLVWLLYYLLGKPAFYFNMNDNKSVDEMVGTLIQNDEGAFVYVPAELIQAMRSGGAYFVDELNLSQMPEYLNVVMDKGEIPLPDGTIVKAQKGFKIIAAMNPSREKGRSTLSPALKSRWHEIWVEDSSDRGELIAIAGYILKKTGNIMLSILPLPEIPTMSNPTSFAVAPAQVPPTTPLASGDPTVTVVRQANVHGMPVETVVKAVRPVLQAEDAPKEPRLRGDDPRFPNDEGLRYLSQEERVRRIVAHASPPWLGQPGGEQRMQRLLADVRRLKNYVHDMGVQMGGDEALTLVEGEGDYWAHDLKHNTLIYPLLDLLKHSPEYIRDVSLHEGSHRDISRYRPEDPLYTAFFEKETTRLLLNVIEDPRVNNNVERRFPGRGMLGTLYEEEWPKDISKVRESEAGKGLLADYGVPIPGSGSHIPQQMLPHMQYANGIIHLWRHHEIAEFVADPDAREMLEAHRARLEEMFNLLPAMDSFLMPDGERIETEPGEIAKLNAMDQLVARIHQEIIPDYNKLLAKSQSEVEQMIKSGQLNVGEGRGQGQSIPPELIPDAARKFIEDQAAKANKKFNPKLNPPKYDETVAAGKEAAKNEGAPKTPSHPTGPTKAPETYGDLLRQKIHANQVASAQRDRFEHYLHPVMEHAARLRSHIENLLYPNAHMKKVGHFTQGGIVDPKRLMVGYGRGFRNRRDREVMLRKQLPTKRRYAGSFVIDHSGSMSGTKEEAAKRLLAMLTYAFEGLIPIAEYGFSDGVSRYVDFPDQLNDKEKDRLMSSVDMAYEAGGGTNLPAAIALATEELDHRKATASSFLSSRTAAARMGRSRI
jgi:MoxR-like ATPase